jgi:hypothetical protein
METKNLTIRFESAEPICVGVGTLRSAKAKTIGGALQDLLAEDYPHIANLLRDGGDNYDFELSYDGEGAAPAEVPLNVDDDWERNVVAACENTQTAELAIAEHVAGGERGNA